LILDLLVGLGDLLLEAADAFDLGGGHADGGADVGGLLEDGVVCLLALLDEHHLLLVGRLEGVVDVLVLLPEGVEVVVANYFLEEHLEFALHLIVLVLLHAHLFDLLLELDFVLDCLVVDVAVVVA
jgi:hypothetical protein